MTKSMSMTEKKAKRWFLSQGYKENEIKYNWSGYPDFKLSDGTCYLIKRLYGNSIDIKREEYESCKETNASILVFKDSKNEPVLEIPITKLEEGQRQYEGIWIKWVDKNPYVTIKLDAETLELIKEMRISTEGWNDIIRRLVEESGKLVSFNMLSVDYDEPEKHTVIFQLGNVYYKYEDGKFYMIDEEVIRDMLKKSIIKDAGFWKQYRRYPQVG